MWHYLRDPTFSRFDTIPECDTQTDRHTTTAYTALSIASRGKKVPKHDFRHFRSSTARRCLPNYIDRLVTCDFLLVFYLKSTWNRMKRLRSHCNDRMVNMHTGGGLCRMELNYGITYTLSLNELKFGATTSLNIQSS